MGHCPSCGNSNAAHARFCQACGAALPEPVSGETLSPDETSSPGEVRDDSPPVQREYGGFWVRVVAAIIDWMVVGVATGIIAAAAMGLLGVGVTLFVVISWLYEAFLLSSERQATLGKLAMGLVVTDYNDRRLTFGRATGRHFAKYLSGVILWIGYIMVAFTDRKQGLHDMVASTFVVRTST